MTLHRYFNRAKDLTGHRNSQAHTAAERFEKGIFCDCAGTLFVDGVGEDAELVAYLNAQHASGRKVVLFSDEPSQKMQEKVRTLGLDPALTEHIRNKRAYQDITLEMLIDDAPELYLKAATHFHPHDTSFRNLIRQYSALHPMLLPIPMMLKL